MDDIAPLKMLDTRNLLYAKANTLGLNRQPVSLPLC